jgi:hypothetical protein
MSMQVKAPESHHQVQDGPRPTETEASPLVPQNLVNLFVRPAKFFSDKLALGQTPHLMLALFCFGFSSAIDRFDTEMAKAALGQSRPGWDMILAWIGGSWLAYWGAVAGLGLISAAFIWTVGGWWYRKRLIWCGASDPDAKTARLVYIYASFVYAAPVILGSLIITLAYANYASYFAADESYSLLFLIFPFWSLWVSYTGAKTMFDVKPGKAKLWFLVLPSAFYVLAFGLIAMLFALMPVQ